MFAKRLRWSLRGWIAFIVFCSTVIGLQIQLRQTNSRFRTLKAELEDCKSNLAVTESSLHLAKLIVENLVANPPRSRIFFGLPAQQACSEIPVDCVLGTVGNWDQTADGGAIRFDPFHSVDIINHPVNSGSLGRPSYAYRPTLSLNVNPSGPEEFRGISGAAAGNGDAVVIIPSEIRISQQPDETTEFSLTDWSTDDLSYVGTPDCVLLKTTGAASGDWLQASSLAGSK